MRAQADGLPAGVRAPDGWWWQVWRRGATSVLLISDSGAFRGEIGAVLEGEGYAVRIQTAGEPRDPAVPYDLVVLDMAVTTESPAVVCASVRAHSSVPILAVAPELVRESFLVAAYDAGVDQCVATSFRTHELLARTRALLRRSPPQSRGLRSAGSVTVDLSTCTAVVSGVDVPLTMAEAEVLHGLLERPGAVVPRQDLTRSTRVDRLDRNLDAVVRQVRGKLEAVEGVRRIVAVRGLGFRFLLDGEWVDAIEAG